MIVLPKRKILNDLKTYATGANRKYGDAVRISEVKALLARLSLKPTDEHVAAATALVRAGADVTRAAVIRAAAVQVKLDDIRGAITPEAVSSIAGGGLNPLHADLDAIISNLDGERRRPDVSAPGFAPFYRQLVSIDSRAIGLLVKNRAKATVANLRNLGRRVDFSVEAGGELIPDLSDLSLEEFVLEEDAGGSPHQN